MATRSMDGEPDDPYDEGVAVELQHVATGIWQRGVVKLRRVEWCQEWAEVRAPPRLLLRAATMPEFTVVAQPRLCTWAVACAASLMCLTPVVAGFDLCPEVTATW